MQGSSDCNYSMSHSKGLRQGVRFITISGVQLFTLKHEYAHGCVMPMGEWLSVQLHPAGAPYTTLLLLRCMECIEFIFVPKN